ncbi:MAG TPA: RNB domain-containing ribonuclease, partial [Thermoanaerobaculia bacterium]
MSTSSLGLPQRPELHEAIIALLRQRGNRLLGTKDIFDRLGDTDATREEVDRAVEDLEREGTVMALRGKRYSLLEFTPYHAGVIRVYNDGHGTVRGAEDEPDIYVDRKQLKGAMNSDLVIVRVDRRSAKTRRVREREYIDGEVIRILRRAHRTVVGRFHLVEPEPYVVPFDIRIDTDILIESDDTMDARNGEMVNVEIERYPDRTTHFATGRIVEVLGFIGDPGVDIEVVVRKHHIPHNFPPEVLREAESIPVEVTEDEIAKRVDLRDRNIVTIDGETAKDFDDAVEVQQLPNGNFLLGVHIADVSHYVTEKSELDVEAFERGTSVYFPGRAVPMLPEVLSNGICSLNPKVERLTFSCEIEIDPRGRFVNHKIYKSVIRTRERMTYTDVNAILVARGVAKSSGAERDAAAEANGPALLERYGYLLADFERMHTLYEV